MAQLSEENRQLIGRFNDIVGHSHVLTKNSATRRYRKGFRFGDGPVLAVVKPGSLYQQWQILQACVEADVIVITQAANTGLTGGSTPDGDDYDRPIVIVNVMRINQVHLIQNGEQVVCLPGSTLDELEKRLRPLGREPHSVIGSSCLGASVLGGICNNSGGSLVRRGPAYTELAIFAQLDEQGQLKLVNHLGIELGDDPKTILSQLEKGQFKQIHSMENAKASDNEYQEHIRDVDANSAARFNADPRRLYEASGCAGKLMVFAVRLDTFEAQKDNQVFYIGTNDPDVLEDLRREMLAHFKSLPISGEYIHRDCYDIAEKYGKDTFLMINWLGTDRLPLFFSLKSRFDGWCAQIPGLSETLSDRILQGLSRLFPNHLPKRMQQYRQGYEHHLLLKMAGDGIDEARQYLKAFFKSHEGDFFECTPDEGKKAFLHRFAAAGAAVRYRAVHPDTVEDIVALDIALKRNERQWEEHLPEDIDKDILVKLYYGHFFCHVFHQDYVIRKGANCLELEHKMWALLDQRQAQYPAEHNVGHLYPAGSEQAKFYQELDPCNAFNPGIGQTSKCKHWHEHTPH
ncbi:D-lactate dehydrogenase [Celerinatantimonas diazotrophica]|uniref:Quinone-dependent D-lactate dehydrogenase n=1 Tax=Celerinatantimonas diazotrophica TaxID=412034 RepID=A0A4R1J8Z9_9GAMM|nr:D-lactate dehydrogenase [Celerinatantimonas diazotrophica]TCK47062.1 D-lactate dehydrogenase [Celerinatantimonas diazotrophica]CAG9295831.1 Quinone-dependent D-lactate dehydrogenase [Celerinatantimonas diazotrophica]